MKFNLFPNHHIYSDNTTRLIQTPVINLSLSAYSKIHSSQSILNQATGDILQQYPNHVICYTNGSIVGFTYYARASSDISSGVGPVLYSLYTQRMSATRYNNCAMFAGFISSFILKLVQLQITTSCNMS